MMNAFELPVNRSQWMIGKVMIRSNDSYQNSPLAAVFLGLVNSLAANQPYLSFENLFIASA